MVYSDLTYLEDKFFDLLIASRDYDVMSRDIGAFSKMAQVDFLILFVFSINSKIYVFGYPVC